MDDRDSWTGYAPVDGPAEDTTCSFCKSAFVSKPRPGWMISKDAAICPRCIEVAARGLARSESSSESDSQGPA